MLRRAVMPVAITLVQFAFASAEVPSVFDLRGSDSIIVRTVIFEQRENGICVTDEEQRRIESAIKDLGPKSVSSMMMPPLEDPMGAGGTYSPGKPLGNYVDLAPGAGLLDYNCGTVTYEGHNGLDIGLTDFYDMDEGVPCLAAAPGLVILVDDGHFDRNITPGPGLQGNQVVIQHDDGSTASYFHLRKNSIQVEYLETVQAGDTLGLVGSSGHSSGPHIHFEVRDAAHFPQEPFSGSCRSGSSLWQSQGAYVMDRPFELFMHGLSTYPVHTWAQISERPPSASYVTDPDTIYSWINFRSIQSGDVVSWALYANGTLWDSLSATAGASSALGLGALIRTLPSSPAFHGNWEFRIYHNSTLIAQQYFVYGTALNQAPLTLDSTFEVPNVNSNRNASGEFTCNDPDGLAFWYIISSGPSNGTLVQEGGRKRKFTYTPDGSFSGMDTVRYYAVDDDSATGALCEYIFVVTGTEWYPDIDGDTYGDQAAGYRSVSAPPGYVSLGGDCDDANVSINPGAPEYCNGVDDNCDAVVDEDAAVDATPWYRDLDQDGYGEPTISIVRCNLPGYFVANNGDCNDGDPAIHPGATEVCNTIDDDCDGVPDDNPVDGTTYYQDGDGDGYGNPAVTLLACAQPVGYASSGNDCDDGNSSVTTTYWYQDADGDGYGNSTVIQESCSPVSGYVLNFTDCNDADSTRHPGAAEHCNLADDDCDGNVDESAVDAPRWFFDSDGDGYGNPNVAIAACQQPESCVADSTDCDDGNPFVYPGEGCGCACDCHGDPGGPCDGFTNILDVTQVVNAAFRNYPPMFDPNATCPLYTPDVNCSGNPEVLDVVRMVNVAFRGGNPATEFCNPCP